MERTDKPLSELMRDLVDQVSTLIRHEIRLARAEMGEKASQAGSGVSSLAMALMFGIGAVVVLLLSAVAALENVVAPWLSALIVGAVAALVAFALAAKGKSDLRARNLMPERTMGSIRGDTHYVREKASEAR